MTQELKDHTPGPWFVIEHPKAWTIQTREQGGGLCIAQSYGDSPEANARLIAEAPIMLARIEQLEAEIAALRSGLAFYARENNWRSMTVWMCGHGALDCQAMHDKGNKARALLKGQGK